MTLGQFCGRYYYTMSVQIVVFSIKHCTWLLGQFCGRYYHGFVVIQFPRQTPFNGGFQLSSNFATHKQNEGCEKWKSLLNLVGNSKFQKMSVIFFLLKFNFEPFGQEKKIDIWEHYYNFQVAKNELSCVVLQENCVLGSVAGTI